MEPLNAQNDADFFLFIGVHLRKSASSADIFFYEFLFIPCYRYSHLASMGERPCHEVGLLVGIVRRRCAAERKASRSSPLPASCLRVFV